MPQVINTLPPGSYVLDCSPYGPPKLLQVDPATLTQEQRISICKGISTFQIHKELELKHFGNNQYEIRAIDRGIQK